jgi:hypothetical protein
MFVGVGATVELYYTATADGDGYVTQDLTAAVGDGNVEERVLRYKSGAFGDSGTTLGWTDAGLATDATYAEMLTAFNNLLKTESPPISVYATRAEVSARTGLLDDYPGAAAAYSLRLLDSDYTGSAIRVRRASDNTEQDIGFDGNGDLDTSALATFCAGTDGFVKVWYDQSGNSNDATQTTTSSQPKIYDSSTGVPTENEKPTLDFAAHYLAATWDIGTEVSCAVVCADVPIVDWITGNNNSNSGFLIQHRYSTVNFWLNSSFSDYQVNVDLRAQQGIISGAFNSSNQKMYVNGSSNIRTDSRAFDGTGRAFRIGYNDNNATGVLTGKVQEVIFWNTYLPDDITSIHSDVNTYYSVYTP